MVYKIEIYETENGKLPFYIWMFDIFDIITRQLIRIRLERLSLGNFGNCKSLKNGISELKIDHGPGYRIYFAMISFNRVLILCAGLKKTQTKDIKMAKNYLKNFKVREGKNGTK